MQNKVNENYSIANMTLNEIRTKILHPRTEALILDN